MDKPADSPTSASLLGRLRNAPTDQAAWREFVRRYGGQIYGWCRHWGLQQSDAEDVTGDVLLKLAAKMRAFTYDPGRSFRGWLRTLAHHAWSDFLAGRQGREAGTGDTQVLGLLQSTEARDDLVQQLEQEYDRELLEEAMA